ncbi:hypothetical protein [Paenibacillus polymyxa]|uniref:hypothetical protein n=1 Tax=Paenibacillus polymyxa TaxID=1406 RepID=UPI00287F4EF5|nr:hypothetical protein [Paenibacillus polymyxa]
MKKILKFKSGIALVIAFCLLFSVSASVYANDSVSVSDDVYGKDVTLTPDGDIKVIEENDTQVTVMGEDKGVELYATYDKITHAVTMRTVEKQKNVLGFSLAQSRENIYSVDVKNAVDGKIEAIATNDETNDQFKIESSSFKEERVQAQAPLVLIPVAEWLGSAVLAALLAAAAVVVIDGYDYVAVSKVETNIQKEKNAYYRAFVQYESNNVFVGPKISYNEALKWLRESQKNNIFTRDRLNAQTLAYNLYRISPYHHDNEFYVKGEGYYRHYHPRDPEGEKLSNHVWYLN